MDVLQVLFSLWTGNRCTAGLPEAIEKLTAEEQQEIRAYCENNERQAFDVGFKTAVQPVSYTHLTLPTKLEV